MNLKQVQLPTQANLENCASAWAVCVTAPHLGWRIYDLYTSRAGATAATKKLWTYYDGIFVTRVTFGKRTHLSTDGGGK